ncbi:protein kinase domain-containing protein, partial [Floridanema evergladense]
MSYCLNPNCPKPQNPTGTTFCLTCGAKILLKDRYRATNFLAAGGMGKNFLAVDEDTPLKKRCVIKQFSPDSSIVNNPTAFQKAIELFNREAAMLDTLGDESPQIPRLLAYLEQDQCLYFVQEFIEGHNLLKELAQKGTYNEAQIYQLLNDLLPVLKFIHQQDVIHRDIKPENIMRRPNGELVLIDFGISKQFSGTLISMGTSVGTLGYAPPEQMTYGEAYPASDIYALGATCIHLLTDVSPDQLFNVRENCWLWRDVLATKGIYISQQLGQILDKMLITDVRERYQSVDEILVILAHTRQWRSKSHVSWYCRYTLMEHSEAVRAVVISPDGQTLVTGSDDKTIKIWNLSNGKLLGTLNGHNNWIYALAISPDGNTLVSGSGSILGHHQI